VPAKDWAFCMSEENTAKAQSDPMMKAYFANVQQVYAGIESKVTKYEWGQELTGSDKVDTIHIPRPRS
jgi:hypothetical protein